MTKKSFDPNSFLSLFGLNQKERSIYLLLVKLGWSTASSISQKSPIKRTTIYRILESLHQKGIVEARIDEKITYYQATDPQVFQSLILKTENKLNKMQTDLVDFKLFSKFVQNDKSSTSVHFYRGVKGVETIEWKLSQLKNTDIFMIGPSKWADLVKSDLSEKIRLEHLLNQNIIKEIHNPDDSSLISSTGQASWTKNSQYIKNCYQHRVIDKQILDLTDYNDLIITPKSIYLHCFQADEVVGIEINNSNYALFMSQIFKILWNLSKSTDTFSGVNL